MRTREWLDPIYLNYAVAWLVVRPRVTLMTLQKCPGQPIDIRYRQLRIRNVMFVTPAAAAQISSS